MRQVGHLPELYEDAWSEKNIKFWIHIFLFYILIDYSNHLHEISYFLKRCQVYKKNLFGSQPEDGFMKKAKHVAVIIS